MVWQHHLASGTWVPPLQVLVHPQASLPKNYTCMRSVRHHVPWWITKSVFCQAQVTHMYGGWAPRTSIYFYITQTETETLSKIFLNSFMSLDKPAVHFSHLRWEKNVRRSVVIVKKNSVNSYIAVYFASLNASAIFEFLHFHVTGIASHWHEMFKPVHSSK